MQNESIALKIGGMGCRACSEKIEKALSGLPGVLEARFDHAAGRGMVRYEGEKLSKERIEETIEELGYDVLGEA